MSYIRGWAHISTEMAKFGRQARRDGAEIRAAINNCPCQDKDVCCPKCNKVCTRCELALSLDECEYLAGALK